MNWEDILLPYKQAADELEVKFQNISLQYQAEYKITPFLSVEKRIKSISSILAKARRKRILISNIEEQMQDIVGIRVICRFMEDIPEIISIIEKRRDMEIVKNDDYINESKPSGYRSHHITVAYPVHTISGEEVVQCEIQIRTLAMNFWAVAEHSLRYKYDGNIPPDIQKRLIKTAEAASIIDTELSYIREDILDAEMNTISQEQIILDITSSIEELYNVAESREVEALYQKFIVILDSQDDIQLDAFYDEVMLIASAYEIR